MSKAYEETTDLYLREMFKRVGIEYPNPDLTDQDAWYTIFTWTQEEQDNFAEWMKELVKARHKWNKKKVDYEVGMFLLMWGWKCVD